MDFKDAVLVMGELEVSSFFSFFLLLKIDDIRRSATKNRFSCPLFLEIKNRFTARDNHVAKLAQVVCSVIG